MTRGATAQAAFSGMGAASQSRHEAVVTGARHSRSACLTYNPRLSVQVPMMSPKATVYKAELQVSDMDRHYYAAHDLVLAQHPSETEARLMTRLIAFALFAEDRLEFGRGLSNDEEPDLWRRDYTGDIEQWIDLGQPDESRIRKACGRARQVVVVNYSGNAAGIWWDKHASALSRLKNLTVVDFDAASIEAATALLQRSMRLTAMLQDGELQLLGEAGSVSVTPHWRLRAPD